MLFGTDSHTCMAGAFNQFATGIGNTDAGFILGTGKMLIKVPETMRFYLEGELPPGVMAKDVILHVIGDIGFDGATYRAMQWEGPGVDPHEHGRSHDDREHGDRGRRQERHLPLRREDAATTSDERVAENGTKSDFEPVEIDAEQSFVYDKVFDLSKLEPTVACHPDPGQRKLAKEMSNVTLDRAYIGSCTGGKTSDFLAFAEVVRGKTVKIDTFGVPATTKVVQELKETRWDGKSVWEILESAGVRMTENASCAACLGGPVDTFGRMNTPMKCISATNRNFPGRMGHKESQVFLASPYTVAASALTGQITDPREFIS